MIPPNRPYFSFPEPIPVPPPNRGDFCFTVDGKWKPYILGALFPLLAQRTWLSDDPEVIRDAGDLLAAISMARKCQPPDTTGVEVQEDCEMKLRICGGKLQRSEEHTSELQSHSDLVCRLLLEKKKKKDRRCRQRGRNCNRTTDPIRQKR